MNNDTIKTVGKALTEYEVIIAQKDEQIKGLVEVLQWMDLDLLPQRGREHVLELIQKHKK